MKIGKIVTSLILVLVAFSVNVLISRVQAFSYNTQINSTVLYVKPGSTGDCLSWDTACGLQVALSRSLSGDKIWVASGTYFPTSSTDRYSSFQLKSGVAIYGGFPSTGGDWASRDPKIYSTILSGDIGLPGDNSDNSYHVVYANQVDQNSILDGFTITAGHANGIYPENRGGGVFIRGSNLRFENLVILQNSASDYGGGIFSVDGSPSFKYIEFSNNSSDTNGGGLFNYHCNTTMDNITFIGNSALGHAGGMYDYNGMLSLTNFAFTNNSADVGGGGILIYLSNVTITQGSFWGGAEKVDTS